MEDQQRQPEYLRSSQANAAYQAIDADLTLISQDGTAFKVHQAVLAGASTVFRTMFQAAKSTDTGLREIMLSDERTEKKWSIRLFLDLLYGVEIPPPEIGYRKYVNVTDLLDKYECKAAKTAWKWAIGNWVRDEQSSELAVFLVAASARLWEQCRLVLQATTRTWRSDNWQLNGRMSIEQTLRISLNEQQDDKRPLLKTETDDIGDIECWASDTEEASVFDLGTWPQNSQTTLTHSSFLPCLGLSVKFVPLGSSSQRIGRE